MVHIIQTCKLSGFHASYHKSCAGFTGVVGMIFLYHPSIVLSNLVMSGSAPKTVVKNVHTFPD